MAIMMYLTFGIPFVFLVSITSISAEVSCSTCIHMNMTFYNLPENVIEQLNMMLSSFSNPGCLKGTTQKVACKSSLRKRSKCLSSVVRGRFVGMKNLYPEAIMEQNLLVRACAERPIAEADKCIGYDDLDLETKSSVTASLEQARKQWDSLTVTAETCFKGSDVPYNPPTTKRPGSGSGGLFNTAPYLVLLPPLFLAILSKM